jgi:integrase
MGRIYQRIDLPERPWAIDFTDEGGRRFRRVIGTDKKLAQLALKRYEGLVVEGKHLGRLVDSGVSFSDFADIWLEKEVVKKRPNTQRRFNSVVRVHLKPAFRGSLRAITGHEVAAYVAKRIEAGTAPRSLNSELIVLKLILGYAVEQQMIAKNPLKDGSGKTIKAEQPVPTPDGRVRYLTPEEIDRLLVECDKETNSASVEIGAFVRVALNTALRKEEVLGPLARRGARPRDPALGRLPRLDVRGLRARRLRRASPRSGARMRN